MYAEYGSGVKSRYRYDQYRRWLSRVETESPAGGSKFQDITYEFDHVGNVSGYENASFGHTTGQRYEYDALYQLTGAHGSSRSHPNGQGGHTEYLAEYRQAFSFSRTGNMTSKTSEAGVSSGGKIGDGLNYSLDYEYYPGTHKAERIGNRYYDYDRNGNLVAERDGGHAAASPGGYLPYEREGDLYSAGYGFGLTKPGSGASGGTAYQREYRWNERNLLSESIDGQQAVQYRYGADGQRALKHSATSGRTTAYFSKMWQTSDGGAEWLQGKHVYVGEERVATKYSSEGNGNTQAERTRVYYYHADHLGSAQVVTNWRGQAHERLEYTPYGELWVDWMSGEAPEDKTPYRFTAKELDEETGLYYYGARYLDPKTGRWLSGDPALGDYLPSAPVDEEARKRNGNLPGQGGVYNYVNLHVYHYAGNNPVKYTDPDGEKPQPHIELIIKRDIDSPRSNGDRSFRGRDIGILINHETNETIRIYGGQTVVNGPEYDKDDTVRAHSGQITYQYLGENKHKGQSLYNGFQSQFEGPVINITQTVTEGWGDIDGNGVIIGSSNTDPVRIHSDKKLGIDKNVGLISGGCFVFPKAELEKMQQALEKWGVEPGDTFGGYVREPIPDP